MSSVVETLAARIIGSVESVSPDRISVLIDADAPHATALSTGTPTGFPRINGYVLIPNESGATACVVSSVRIERLPYPKRKGTQHDFGLVDLPFPSRLMSVTPLGTLGSHSATELELEVHRGVDVFPSVGDPVVLPTADQLRAIVQGQASGTAGRVLLGHCPTAGRAPVYVDPDRLFGRHLAILGNTGAGKSCTVAGLIRWCLDAASAGMHSSLGRAPDDPPERALPNARFIVLDPNGEYASAFGDLGVRVFRLEPNTVSERPLRVPAWLWNGEEWAAFTGASPGVQRPVLFDALRRLRSGLGPPDALETHMRGMVKRYSTRLRLLVDSADHQAAGRREGVAEVLLNIDSDFSNVAQQLPANEAEVVEALRKVATTAREAEASARQERRKPDGTPWHNDFSEVSLRRIEEALADVARKVQLEDQESLVDEDTPRPFSVGELPDYVTALAADRAGRDMAQFVDTLNLRIRSILARGRLSAVLDPTADSKLTLEDWLKNHIGADRAANGPIAVIDLSLVPSEIIHVLISVIARVIFEAVQRYRREEGRELPTALVLEEAHTFIHRDLSGESAPAAGRACARVFERIAREGRKFGLGLVLASQRPSEISATILSQCNTFLLHRIVNDRDQELVRRLVPDALGTLLRDLPSLPSRRAILLGWAAPAPVLVEVREVRETHRPHSPDPAFWRVWTGEEERPIDWRRIARLWQALD